MQQLTSQHSAQIMNVPESIRPFTALRRRKTAIVCIVSLVVHNKAVVNKIETVGASFIRTGNHLTH